MACPSHGNRCRALAQVGDKHTVGEMSFSSGEAGTDLLEADGDATAKARPVDQEQLLSEAIAHHQSGEFDAAEQGYQQVLQLDADRPEALHGLGLIRYRQGDYEDSRVLILRACELRPDYAAAWVNLGNTYSMLYLQRDALAAYEKAIELWPDHPEANCNCGTILNRLGREAEAEAAFRRAIAADPNCSAALNNLGGLLKDDGRLDEAEHCLRQAVQARPNYPEAYVNLSAVVLLKGDADQSLRFALDAVMLNSDMVQGHVAFGVAMANAGWPSAPLERYARLLNLNDSRARPLFNLGNALSQWGDFEAAVEAYERALRVAPEFPAALSNVARAYRRLNRIEDAVHACTRALECSPDDPLLLGDLATCLELLNRLDGATETAKAALQIDHNDLRSNIVLGTCDRRQGRVDEAIERLESLDMTGAPEKERIDLTYELAQAYDRKGDYATAFEHFETANRLCAESSEARKLTKLSYQKHLEANRDGLTPEKVAGWRELSPYEGPTPIFLVGFPRSGTTLLENILDAYPGLLAMDEAPAVRWARQVVEMSPEGYPDGLANIDDATLAEARDEYFRRAEVHLRQPISGRQLVDKMPLNMTELGMISRMFPDAKVILALRHPCDCVLSAFMQNFRMNAAMVHLTSLQGAAKLYAEVFDLWAQLVEVLDVTHYVIRYEDLVADFEHEIRSLIDHLDLPWRDEILSYATRSENRRITTPSYQQVLQPIYRRASGRWLNYRDFIKPVLPNLAPYVARHGYPPVDVD